MASGKQSPRQKMINMMYLVLTAILALNVASEVLNAFVVINMGLLQQNKSLDSKNASMITEFANQRVIDSGNKRVQFLNEQALYIKKISDEVSNDIEKMKVELVMKVEKVDESRAMDLIKDPIQVDRKDDYDGPTHFFGTSDPPGTGGKAHDLKVKLSQYREQCLQVVDKVLKGVKNNTQLRADIESKLSIIHPVDPEAGTEFPTWEMQYFYHLPQSAALTELTKWQNFVKGAESDMLSFLWNDISRDVFRFNMVKVAVIPKSNFVTSGSNFEADVFLAAYSTSGSNVPVITYGTSVDTNTMQVTGGVELDKSLVKEGVGRISFPVSGAGERTFAGTLKVKDPSGNIKTLPFSTTYNVSPPMASIAATELKVVYFGVDNPFSISVPGYAPNQLVVTTSGGKISGANGRFIINPSASTGYITINVSARDGDGNIRSMGSEQYKVKKVPDPKILLSGQPTGSKIRKSVAANSPIIPDMSEFLFPVYASVVSIKGMVNATEFSFQGNTFPSNIRTLIQNAKPNSKLYLDEIIVQVPGGTRKLSAVYTLIN